MKSIRHIIDLLRPPLAVRLALLFVLVICGAMSALGWGISTTLSDIQARQADDLGAAMSRYLARMAREPVMAGDRLTLEVMVTSLLSGESLVGAEILSDKGEPLVSSGLVFSAVNPVLSRGIKARFSGEGGVASWEWRTGGAVHVSYAVPIRYQGYTAGYAVVYFNRSYLEQSRRTTIDIILLATLVTTVLAALAAYFVSRRLSAPVHRIMNGVEAFREGNFNFRFKERRRDEFGQLMEALNQMAAGIVRKEQLESMLNRYLSPQVVSKILNDVDQVTLGGRRIRGSVVFADVVGFTRLSESLEPEKVAAVLNHYFGLINRACELCLGMVDKYMGDCAMLVFGALDDDPEHCFHALFCAELIRLVVREENRLRRQAGETAIEFRMGVNTGTMLAGNLGSKNRMDYTVVGDSVNLASRLCGVSGPGDIIISEEIYRRPVIQQRFRVVEHQRIRLRGITEKVPTYRVLGIAPHYLEKLHESFRVVTGYDPRPDGDGDGR